MEEIFNNKLLFDNITYLIKKQNKKIGEVEQSANVSPGYISRTSKEPNAKPSIDFVINISNILNVSIDYLLKTDISKVTATETYLLDFINKINSDSINDKVMWEKVSKFNPKNSEIEEHFYQNKEIDKDLKNSKDGIAFYSNTYGKQTILKNDYYKLELSKNKILYVIKVENKLLNSKQQIDSAIEMWIGSEYNGFKFLCGTKTGKNMKSAIENLYMSIEENLNHPRIESDLKDFIDSYMEGGNDL